MKILRTYDMGKVAEIMSHPAIWPHIHEDGLERPEPIDHEGFYWMLAVDGNEVAGLFLVHQHSAVCYEMHTMIMPAFYGRKASEAAQSLLRWAFEETDCRKLITNVPAYNRAALRFARANGMREEGINRASFLYGGKLIDQIILGMKKEEWELCQQQPLSQQPQ